MLKLKNISAVQTVHNKSDFYIKVNLTFDCQKYSRGSIYYWSTLGPKKSFIEIGLNSFNGGICKLAVISSPSILCNQKSLEAPKDIIKKIGLPLFETDAWHHEGDPSLYYPEHYQEGYYVREKNDFQIWSNNTSVTLVFSSHQAVLHVLNNEIIFGFDRNNFLCFIQIEGMKLNSEGFLEKSALK